MAARRLSKSEKRLFVICLAVVFVVANFLGFNWVMKERSQLQKEIHDLKSEKEDNEVWLKEKDTWSVRQDWLTKYQPKITDVRQGNVDLLDELQKLGKDNNLTIQDPALQDPHALPDYEEVAVQLKVVGSLESLCRWLAAVQQPKLFQAITYFSLKSDTDPTKVRCELRVCRWYQPNAPQ